MAVSNITDWQFINSSFDKSSVIFWAGDWKLKEHFTSIKAVLKKKYPKSLTPEECKGKPNKYIPHRVGQNLSSFFISLSLTVEGPQKAPKEEIIIYLKRMYVLIWNFLHFPKSQQIFLARFNPNYHILYPIF